MARTYLLERTQWIPARREEVFRFFSDAGNLETSFVCPARRTLPMPQL